jgi:hypothetical protein
MQACFGGMFESAPDYFAMVDLDALELAGYARLANVFDGWVGQIEAQPGETAQGAVARWKREESNKWRERVSAYVTAEFGDAVTVGEKLIEDDHFRYGGIVVAIKDGHHPEEAQKVGAAVALVAGPECDMLCVFAAVGDALVSPNCYHISDFRAREILDGVAGWESLSMSEPPPGVRELFAAFETRVPRELALRMAIMVFGMTWTVCLAAREISALAQEGNAWLSRAFAQEDGKLRRYSDAVLELIQGLREQILELPGKRGAAIDELERRLLSFEAALEEPWSTAPDLFSEGALAELNLLLEAVDAEAQA